MTRWTLSPVFVYECALAARRWQTYAGRVVFLLILLVSLLVAWAERAPAIGAGPMRLNDLARVGETFYLAIAGTQLVLALLAAPAYLAASICLDKSRGTLTHMLVADLTSTEIVVGKLLARALPVFGMLLAGVPVLVLATLLGGVEPEAVVASFFIIAAVALVTCALTLAFSVWANKPHEVLLATYVVEAVWLLAWLTWREMIGFAPDWLRFMDPFQRLFGAVVLDEFGRIGECAVFVAILTGLAGLLTLLAALTLRWAACRDGTRRKSRWPWRLPRLPRWSPKLDWNPVLWREWQRRPPSRWLRIIWGLYFLGCIAASVAAVCASGMRGEALAAFVNAFQVSIGLLLVAISSVSTLFEERVNGSLDMLMTTPLTTGQILWGKWLAGMRLVFLIMLIPMLLGLVLGLAYWDKGGFAFVFLLIGLASAYGVFVNSLGLALATWVRRFGVAMGLTVTIYVVLAAGPVLILLAGHSKHREGLACASPWYGPGETTVQIAGRMVDENVGIKVFWMFAYSVSAAALMGATLLTFDRCMGRVPAWPPFGYVEHWPRRPPKPAARNYESLTQPASDNADQQ